MTRHLEGWRLRGLCATHPSPDLWFADTPTEVAAAKAVCAVCPVQATCLADALARGETWGVLGGHTGPERRALAAGRGLPRPNPAGAWQHGSPAGYKAHGCRCHRCRAAHAADMAAWRRQHAWAATPGRIVVPIHTLTAPAGRGPRRAWPGQLYAEWSAA